MQILKRPAGRTEWTEQSEMFDVQEIAPCARLSETPQAAACARSCCDDPGVLLFYVHCRYYQQR